MSLIRRFNDKKKVLGMVFNKNGVDYTKILCVKPFDYESNTQGNE